MTTSRPRVLIEDWLPVAELGIESRREVVELYRAWLPDPALRLGRSQHLLLPQDIVADLQRDAVEAFEQNTEENR